MNELDITRQKFAAKMNVGIGAVTVIAAGLITFVTAGATIILVSTIILALALVNILPVVSRKLAIWKFKALKETAAQNPVETMELEAEAQAAEIEEYQRTFTAREAQGKAFIEEINELGKRDPAGALMYQDQINDYHTEIKDMTAELEQAVKDHEEFKEILALFRGRWRAAQSSAAFAASKPGEKEKMLRKILVDEAMNAVRTKANESSARLKSNAIVNRARAEHKAVRSAGLTTNTQAVQQALGIDSTPTLVFDIAAKEVQPQK